MTVEHADKINKSMAHNAGDIENYQPIPTTENELAVWRKADNMNMVSNIFYVSDCDNCPVDESEEGCPASDDCYDDFEVWATATADD